MNTLETQFGQDNGQHPYLYPWRSGQGLDWEKSRACPIELPCLLCGSCFYSDSWSTPTRSLLAPLPSACRLLLLHCHGLSFPSSVSASILPLVMAAQRRVKRQRGSLFAPNEWVPYRWFQWPEANATVPGDLALAHACSLTRRTTGNIIANVYPARTTCQVSC